MLKERFGIDRTWTGNDREVLKLLYQDSYTDDMSNTALNLLVEEYAGSKRFQDRMKEFKVQRWLADEKHTEGSGGNIPFEDMLQDWYECGFISERILKDSLTIRHYEQAIAQDVNIKKARQEMAAKLCGDIITEEDRAFNGLRKETIK